MEKFEILKEYLGDVTYRSPEVPKVFFEKDKGPDKIGYKLDVVVKGGEGMYGVHLPIYLYVMPEVGDNPVFTLDVVYSGMVSVENIESELYILSS